MDNVRCLCYRHLRDYIDRSNYISNVNTRALDRFYKLLQKTKAVSTNRKTQEGRLVTPGTIRDINKIIRSCFNQAKNGNSTSETLPKM